MDITIRKDSIGQLSNLNRYLRFEKGFEDAKYMTFKLGDKHKKNIAQVQ